MSEWPAPSVQGFFLRRVPGIAPVFLPFLPGLTVLYGLNGAGKTRTLEAIRGIWSGEDTGAEMLVRIPAPAEYEVADPDDPDVVDRLPRVSWLQEEMALSLIPRSAFGIQSSQSSQRPYPWESEEAYLDLLERVADCPGRADPLLGELPESRIDGFYEQLRRQREVLIFGAGSKSSPGWKWRPVASITDKASQIGLEYQRVQAAAAWVYDHWEGDAQSQDRETDLFESSPFEFLVVPQGDGTEVVLAESQWVPPMEFELTWVGADLVSAQYGEHALARRVFSEGRTTYRESRRSGESNTEGNVTAPEDLLLRPFLDAAERYEPEINRYYASILLDAPPLSVRISPVLEWWDKPAIRYLTPAGIGLENLSRAEQNWARWAITQATRVEVDDETPSLHLVDEPEAALHRAAEAYMAEGLAAFAMGGQRSVIAASHSPELLNLPSARLVHVRKVDGQPSEHIVLAHPDRVVMHELGLLPSDLLRRQRAFLLVEGQHDQLVLETLVGRELRRLRVEVLPLRGAKKLPGTIESRLLYDFTDAQVVALVDNVDAQEILDAWREAQRAVKVQSLQAAGDVLRERIGRTTEERGWLSDWLSRALEHGREGRVTPYGLNRPDVIDYLPVERLVPDATSWDELRREHALDRAGARKNCPKDFKQWARVARGATFDEYDLRRAADGLAPPAEFVRLLAEIALVTGQAPH